MVMVGTVKPKAQFSRPKHSHPHVLEVHSYCVLMVEALLRIYGDELVMCAVMHAVMFCYTYYDVLSKLHIIERVP